MNETKTTRILDIPFALLTLKETTQTLMQWSGEEKQRRIITANPEMIVAAHKDEELFHIIRTADLATADGGGVLWAAEVMQNSKIFSHGRTDASGKNHAFRRLFFIAQSISLLMLLLIRPRALKKTIPQRVSGSDLLPPLIASAEQNSKSIFFLGAAKTTLQQLEKTLTAKHPQLAYATSKTLNTDTAQLAASHYDNPENNALIAAINAFRPDVLLVAFGVPKQEKWIYWNLSKIPSVKVAIGIGGALDFFTSTVKRAPRFLQKLNLEWLWRVAIQPWRLPRVVNATVTFTRLVIQSKLRELRGELRPNVVAILLNKKREIFIAKRSDESNHWQFPQGGIEKGETAEEAAVRELNEEIGLTRGRVISVSPSTYTYTWPTPHFLGYIGQKQTICYVEAEDDFIPKLNHDFVEYQWVAQDKLLEQLHPIRRAVGKIVINDVNPAGKDRS